MSADMLEHALVYVGRGWPVSPCRARAKTPATAHGVKDATTDPEIIRRWWTDMPTGNIGIACGGVSGLLALDIDPPAGSR